MKRSTFLTMLIAFVLMALSTGTFAQDDLSSAGDVHDLNLVTGTPLNRDSITVGYQTKYVTLPDLFYHSSYVTPGWALTAGFTWSWTYFNSNGTTQTLPANYTAAAGAKANEVRVTWNTVGNYVLKSVEHSPAAYGGCAGDTSTIAVAVLPVPIRVDFPYFNTTNGMVSTDTLVFCGDQAAVDINVRLTGYPHFEMVWSCIRQEINFAGANAGVGPTTLADYTTAAPQVLGTNNFTTITTNGTYVLENRAFTLVSATLRTKYTYTIKGVNDLYSRKSDYVGGTATWFPNPAADQTYLVIVNPAPNTGPIYHVPNNWGAI